MKIVSLMSGGIDSPVASYLMLKKKCELVLVHFHNQTIQKEYVKNKVVQITNVLSKYGKVKLYLVPFKELQQKIIQTIPAETRMIVYRRTMFRIAEMVLDKEKGEALLTGDCMGQVASQTLDNLGVIHSAAKHPVLTPLLGFDKEETIKIAKEIGTYEPSIEPYCDCCSFMIAKHPRTKTTVYEIEEQEKQMDIHAEMKKALDEAQIIQP